MEIKEQDEQFKKEDKEELEEPLKVPEPAPQAPIEPVEKTKTSNLEDDLGTQFTKTQKTDLTDAGATTLHKHDHGALDGKADDDHTQYHNNTRGDARYINIDGSTAYTGTGAGLRDEDDMASNESTAAASQQSIKAYVDNSLATIDSHNILHADLTQSSITMDETDQTIKTYTLPANTLGTNKGLRIRGEIHKATGGTTPTYSVTLHFGGQVIIIDSGLTSADDLAWHFDVIIYNTATGAQGFSVIGIRNNNVATWEAIYVYNDAGSATVDTTANVVIKLTAQKTAGSGGPLFYSNCLFVELLPTV